MYLGFLLGLISLVILCVHLLKKKSKYKLPSGPRGLPLVGNIHQLIVKNPYGRLSQWADHYGKWYKLYLGMEPAIVINDIKLMREIMGTFQSTGKFQSDTFVRISQGPFGVLNSEGKSWAEQKMFCFKKLKEFGFGSTRMETLIIDEAKEVCQWITKSNNENKNETVHMQPIFVQATINTLWAMVSSSRITLGDSGMVSLMNTFMSAFQYTVKTGLLFLPWLKHMAPGLSGYTTYDKACFDVHAHIENEFKEHKETHVAGVERDLIDAYIDYAADGDELKWKNAVGTVVELFVAGSETTASTLTWLLFYICHKPHIQLKLQQEIDTVIGTDQLPSLDHKCKCIYIEAVILETLRMSSYAPLGTIHKLLDDLEIAEYKFPKGLLLIPNMYHCHFNKNVWEDPEEFRPQRFLGPQGSQLKEHVVPFQVGKRQCIGEPLARDILFIFVTKLLQQFQVYPDPNVKPEEYYSPDIGVVLFPPKLGLIFKPRTSSEAV